MLSFLLKINVLLVSKFIYTVASILQDIIFSTGEIYFVCSQIYIYYGIHSTGLYLFLDLCYDILGRN